MEYQSQEKILSDVEKREFENQIPDINAGYMPKIILFIFVFLLFLILFFSLNILSIVLKKVPANTKNIKSIEISILQRSKQKTVYDFNNLISYPKVDDYSAKSIVLFDINSNSIIFEKNSEQRNLVASLTKLASTKVIYESVDLEKLTTITEESAKYDGSPLVLKSDQIFSNRDLLKASIIVSNNQAIYAMQDSSQTVSQMKSYLKSLRLKNTNFSNPAGFDDNGDNYSTAKDLIPISKVFLDNPELKDYAGTVRSEIFDLNEFKSYRIVNTNELLRNDFYPVIAGKTGTTPRAGQNLMLLIEKNSRRYLIIIIGSAERYKDAMMLIDRI